MVNNSSFITNATSTNHLHVLPILLPAIVIGILISALNVFTICIILRSKRLRRPANYPIISVLLVAALQGLLTAPTYIFKRLDEKQHHEYWLCDFYRLPYFLCGHILKISLMVVSFDRLVAIKYPYRYPYVVTRTFLSIILSLIWFIVIVVDLVPFLPFGKIPDGEGCTYIPSRSWGVTVISVFNILPFVIIAINYLMIWRVAIKITFKDYYLKESVNTCSSERKASHQMTVTQNQSTSLSNRELNSIDKLTTSFIPILEARKSSSAMLCMCVKQHKRDSKCRSQRTSPEKAQETLIYAKENHKKNRNDKTNSKMLRVAWEMKATKTSLMILMVYLLCWGPLGILYMIDNYCLNCISHNNSRSLERFVVKVISFLSSVFIPLVYCWRTKEFRIETCRLTCNKRYRRKKSAILND